MRLQSRLLSARNVAVPVSLCGVLFFAHTPQDEPSGWPREIQTENATILVYQPQIDIFEGDLLEGRSAVSVELTDSVPVFGTVWYSARVSTDRDARIVTIQDLTIPNVRFPETERARQNLLAAVLETEVPKWNLELSLDRLLASLELAEARRVTASGLDNDPPVIIFTTEPSVLVTIDGDPHLREIESTDLSRIINSPFDIVYDPKTERYYLFASETQWYAAPDWSGPWELTSDVPSDVARLAPAEPEDAEVVDDPDAEEPEEEEPGPPPAIVVATEPTELIVSDGALRFAPVEAVNDLLYVSNSESDIVFDIEGQTYYVVLSGRWFKSKSLEDGPWSYVPGDELPRSFSFIPPESDMGHLLVSVPGTEQAEEAVLDNQIPQTAAIDRNTTLTVEYDGDPIFEPIPDTDVAYAANADTPVVQVGDQFYACSDAVWFVSDSPQGSWTVAEEVPEEVYEIPPSSPVYNVTYVHVYHATPTVVYVGYYPGYVGSYVYGGTIVYGTGFWYTPWCCRVYYPHPSTWGFHVRYNPWYGWGFGFSYMAGPFTFGVGWGTWHRRGWWGPVGWRGYRSGYHRGWHQGYRAGARAGFRAGARGGQNVYNRPQNRARNAPRASNQPRTNAQPGAQGRPNNVYSDRSGNVYRRNDSGNWQQRGGNGWQNNQSGNRSQLDRSYQSRQRGSTRTNNYNRSRGGSRGGRRR